MPLLRRRHWIILLREAKGNVNSFLSKFRISERESDCRQREVIHRSCNQSNLRFGVCIKNSIGANGLDGTKVRRQTRSTTRVITDRTEKEMVRQVDGKKHSGVFSWVRDAWTVKRRHPPVGSNRDLALLLTRFLVLLTMIIAVFMVLTGFLFDGVSTISASFAGFWVLFLTSLYIFWDRLPLNVVRGALFFALALYQLRWGTAWLALEAREVPVATIASLLYTPMLLMIVGLMEGQRRGVIIGIAIAIFMAVTAQLGSMRPEMTEVALDDPRIGTLIFLLIAVYVFIQNAWSAQQTLLEERGVQAALLQARANTDPLTGLLNRRGMDIAVTGWLTRREPFGVLLIDIDHFKQLNDSLGHDMGDQAIKLVSRSISESIRDNDVAGRWGGEEFLVVCQESDPRQITAFANRLRSLIAERSDNSETPVTVSVGVSLFPLYEHFEETVSRADAALYAAKAAGRNCVRGEWRTETSL